MPWDLLVTVLSKITRKKSDLPVCCPHCGAGDTLFDPDALSLISSHCRGNRRRIMNAATLLLTEAFNRQEKTIGAELIYNCDQIDISE